MLISSGLISEINKNDVQRRAVGHQQWNFQRSRILNTLHRYLPSDICIPELSFKSGIIKITFMLYALAI